MKVCDDLSQCPVFDRPATVTIGNYDGVHLGHDKVLSYLTESPSAVITFKNHPSKVLRPNQPTLPLCSFSHKLKLLEEYPIDLVIALEFTSELAGLTSAEFLLKLQKKLPFQTLVLGYDAAFGKGREGQKTRILEFAKTNDFKVIYSEVSNCDGLPISSSRIRALLKEGKFKEVTDCLGRPYSYYGTSIKGKGKGREIGFPTLNFSVDGLTTPPKGVYHVSVKERDKVYPAIANLGTAPTIRSEGEWALEVHLLDVNDASNQLQSLPLEVIFHSYMRPEKRFNSIQDLREQIQRDIECVRTKLSFARS